MDIYLYNYNNYYTREIKRGSALSDYSDYLLGTISDVVNWTPNDGITTTQLLPTWSGDKPDYLIAADSDGTIDSRWFVLDAIYTRAGQYIMSLRRDVIADNYTAVLNATSFIEKATLPDSNDLIFNSENMTFNQIKQSETLLKDSTGCPWIVVYAAGKDSSGATTTFSGTIENNFQVAASFESTSAWNEWIGKTLSDSGDAITGGLTVTKFKTYTYQTCGEQAYNYYMYTSSPVSGTRATIAAPDTSAATEYTSIEIKTGSAVPSADDMATAYNTYLDNIKNALADDLEDYNAEDYNTLYAMNGQYVRYYNGTEYLYYRVNISLSSVSGYPSGTQSKHTALWSALYTALNTLDAFYLSSSGSVLEWIPEVHYTANALTVTLTRVYPDTISYDIQSERDHLNDAPYDMFIIPYGAVTITNSADTDFKSVTTSKETALQVARSLIENYAGAGTVYDAQILPYCPSTFITGAASVDVNDSTGKSYTAITETSAGTVGYILHATQSSFSFHINLKTPFVVTDCKIQNETEFIRFCSPNYNSVFEMTPAKNGGVEDINIQCTYKPYTPYIKIYPEWSRLYGLNTSDARGLICGGDFSLPMTTSAWSTYELQNKNYQLTFDRQIEHLEFSNQMQRRNDIINAAFGTFQGATAGAKVGSSAGAAGAAVGAVAGAVASGAAGIYDVITNDKIRAESLDYTQDQFGYTLGNIQALPQSLSKVSAFNVDNKYFPFIEYYTCSDVEREALENKITYNGMTVMTIGKIADYKLPERSYIKAKFIRPSTSYPINDDYHMLSAIADELNKGVFI